MAATWLPDELIMDILVRLPVKSLGQFRCVCKSWQSFINEPSFIRKHVDRANIENEYESAVLFVQTNPLRGQTTFFESTNIIEKRIRLGEFDQIRDSVINNPTMKLLTKDIGLPTEFSSGSFKIKGSCDGIICMASSDFLLLWNPSIKEYKTLALSGERISNSCDGYGIGYHTSTNDYKVFRVPSSSSSYSTIEVLELKSSNSWKTIQHNFSYIIFEFEHSTFNNGAIHWVVFRGGTLETVIVYIDVMEEKLGEVPLPYNADKFSSSICLQSLRGNLSLLQQSMTMNGDLNIWVMKEYGVRESWTKLTLLPLQRPGKDYIVVKVFCNADILFADTRTGDFVMYDPRYKKISNIGGSIGGFIGNIAYVKSLVSPIHSGSIVRN